MSYLMTLGCDWRSNAFQSAAAAAPAALRTESRAPEYYTCQTLPRADTTPTRDPRPTMSLEHRSQLAECVTRATAAYQDVVATTDDPVDRVVALHASRPYGDARHTLEAALRREPDLKIFDGSMVQLRGSWHRVDYCDLAAWLAERTASVGPEIALSDVDRYLAASSYPYRIMATLSGVSVDHECVFTDTISLQPASVLPEYVLKPPYLGISEWLHRPEAVMVMTLEQVKRHVRQHQTKTYEHEDEREGQALRDAVLCLTLAGPSGPVIHTVWYRVDPSIPLRIGFGTGSPWPVETGFAVKLSRDQTAHAAEMYHILGSLDVHHQARVRVALGRLNSSIRRSSIVDAAIDLRITLESLFIDKRERGAQAYKVSLRAGCLLGADPVSRRDYSRWAKRLYQIGSDAVHSGELSPEDGSWVRQAYSRVGFAIERRLLRPSVDWEQLVLGG